MDHFTDLPSVARHEIGKVTKEEEEKKRICLGGGGAVRSFAYMEYGVSPFSICRDQALPDEGTAEKLRRSTKVEGPVR